MGVGLAEMTDSDVIVDKVYSLYHGSEELVKLEVEKRISQSGMMPL